MPRTDLENLEKRKWASKYWREISAASELRDLMNHELLRPAEQRSYTRELEAGDQEQLPRTIKALRHLLIIREREQLAFVTIHPRTAHLLRAA